MSPDDVTFLVMDEAWFEEVGDIASLPLPVMRELVMRVGHAWSGYSTEYASMVDYLSGDDEDRESRRRAVRHPHNGIQNACQTNADRVVSALVDMRFRRKHLDWALRDMGVEVVS